MKTIFIRTIFLILFIVFCFPYIGYVEENPVSFRMIINATFRRELKDLNNNTSDIEYYTTDREVTNFGINGTVFEELIDGRRYSIYGVLYHKDLYNKTATRDLFIYLRQPVYVEGEENCKSGFQIEYEWKDQYNDENYPSLKYKILGDYTNWDDTSTVNSSLLCHSDDSDADFQPNPLLGYERILQGNDRFKNIETIRPCEYQDNIEEASVKIITENIANLCNIPIIHAKSDGPAWFEFVSDEWCAAEIQEEEERIHFTIYNKGTQILFFSDMFIDGPQKSLFSFDLQGNDCDENTILKPGNKCKVTIDTACHYPKIKDVTKNELVIDTNDGNPIRRRIKLPLLINYDTPLNQFGALYILLLSHNSD